MAKIEDIERRLLNWARWRDMAGSGGLGYAAVKLEGGGTRGGYREAKVPVIDCEAAEMDELVQRLPSELRFTLEVCYCESGGETTRMERLMCARSTIHARITQAHIMLARWLADKHQVRTAERQRVDKLQRVGVGRGF
jgi:hypothetical protein